LGGGAAAGGAEGGLGGVAALYITVRPPGRSPPLAGLRVPLSEISFPYKFKVTLSDAYEDLAALQGWQQQVCAPLTELSFPTKSLKYAQVGPVWHRHR
jgi:hypothetical protein